MISSTFIHGNSSLPRPISSLPEVVALSRGVEDILFFASTRDSSCPAPPFIGIDAFVKINDIERKQKLTWKIYV
jgi:hypothetical protein